MTCVTGCSTVSASAPGYVATMATCGGAIGGYDSMPSVLIASTPPSVISSASTHAKMGRWMKKFENMVRLPSWSRAGLN